MHKGLYALLVAAALMLPDSAVAAKRHSTGSLKSAQTGASAKLPLRPIPYLDSIRWLDTNLGLHAPQIEAWLQEPTARSFGVEPLWTAQLYSQVGTEGSAPSN
jgi:hypothetical protein